MFTKILFATDFGPSSARAEDHAVGLAHKHQAMCLVLHAIEPILDDSDNEIAAFYQRLEERAAEKMQRILERLEREGVARGSNIEVGPRWRLILDTATTEACDLIVMGSHSGRKASIGTTSHKVFFATTVPLLVVRP